MGWTARIVAATLTFVLGALILSGGAPAMAATSAVVSIDAEAASANDTAYVAAVSVADLTAFDAGQFDVCFDESVLRLDDVTAGEAGTTQIPVDSWNRLESGKYRVIVNVPGVPGVSGSGDLAILHFHVTGSAGSSTAIDLSNGFLNDNTGAEITATWANHSVQVGDDTPNGVFSSTSKLLIAIAATLGAVLVVGSLACIWMRRRAAHQQGA